MSVASENFNGLIATIVATDKSGVVAFLNSQGVKASPDASVEDLIEALIVGFQNEKFAEAFANWGNTRYSNEASFSEAGGRTWGRAMAIAKGDRDFARADAGDFDPMSAQDGVNLNTDDFAEAGGRTWRRAMAIAKGDRDFARADAGDFDPMSAQDGVNLNTDDFANASGEFDPMATQSGGFTSDESYAGISGRDRVKPVGSGLTTSGLDLSYGYNSPTATTKQKTGVGKFLGSDTFKSIFDTGLDLFVNKQETDQKKELANINFKAKELELEKLRLEGALTQQQYQQQLALLKEDKSAPQSQVLLYVIGGIVLLAGIGTAIYFATRKK